MIVVTNPYYKLHDPFWQFKLGSETYQVRDIYRRPELIREALEKDDSFSFVEAEEFPLDYYHKLHSYVDFIINVCAGIETETEEVYPDLFPGENANFTRRHHPLWMGLVCMDCVTPLKKNTFKAVKGSGDTAMTASRILCQGETDHVYALCRPSGHHAGPRVFGGYCYFNNSGLAAEVLLEKYSRVAIIDIDFHHGNGTQELFYKRSDVMTASIHCDPDIEYPYYTGYVNEPGEGEGVGYNLNLPLKKNSGLPEYLEAIESFAKAAKKNHVDALIIGSGFDTFIDDPIGGFQLKAEDFIAIGKALSEIHLPTVICQEGGYNLENLGQVALNFLRGFSSVR